MGHAIIIGQTESGKSTLAKRLAGWYRQHGIGVLVLDPFKDPGWGADWITDDPQEFLAFVKDPDRCQQCALFIDEGGEMLDRYDTQFNWVTCRSRHHGHVAHLISQRAEDLSRTTRAQASVLYIFSVNPKDAKQYAEDFNSAAALDAPNLPQGTCIRIERFKPPQRITVFTPR